MNIHLYVLIPRRLTSALMHRLARIEKPRWLKNRIIAAYCRLTGADTDFAAEKNPYAYRSLNDFFTRSLADGARPVAPENSAITSPVDGRCAIYGSVDADTILQAKGLPYHVTTLLGSGEWAAYFAAGSSATLYLAPDDYHRIHMPCDGQLLAMRFCPGDKHSVALPLLDKIPGLFAGNERAVCLFATPFGKMALVMVGALNVSSIETVWHGAVLDRGSKNDYDYRSAGLRYKKGTEIGRFNLGSTVILFFENSVIAWKRAALDDARKIRMGETIAETL